MGAPYLLINNNNSRTKFALADLDRLRPERAVIETASLDAAALAAITGNWEFERVVLASVVPDKARMIREFWSGHPVLEVHHRLQLGVTLDLPDPARLGPDRLANAAAVVGLGEELPCIVIDFGTAATFNVVSAEKVYLGGIIAPGLGMMTDYLHERTALLPRIELEEPPEVIGKSTRSAMLSGVVHGYRGLVKELLFQLERELTGGRRHVHTVATGGHAELLAVHLPGIDAVFPDLTLDGIRIIANLNPR
ncbi:MAG: type III pantothenate kinase [Verrucomicrobia bacterium]|nr:type III pantothenate kinase [Verrucomicrobiota bacterium]